MGNRAGQAVMRTYRARRRTALGIATIEVLVAVAVVLMVGTMGILTFGGNDRGDGRSEAADVALFLQQTRLRALELGRPIEIVLSADDRYLRAGDIHHDFPNDITITPDAAELILEPSGGSDGLVMTLSKGDHAANVTMDWLTGRVVVE